MDTCRLDLHLSDRSGEPFYAQITSQLAELIQSGALPRGTKLPSVRALAAHLMVSVITTQRAYAELDKRSLIVRRRGSGTFVADTAPSAAADWAEAEATTVVSDAVRRALRLGLSPEAIRALVTQTLEDRDASS